MAVHKKFGDLAEWLLVGGARLCAEDAAGEEDKPVWIQIAAEGEYHGHPAGPFELGKSDLEQIVANFRSNPKYAAGADGVGAKRVIPFDFHHASEQEPAKLAVVGAPAQAWALELAVRDGEGGAELWALTEYLEPARTYVREGRYENTSVAIWPDAQDPKTGEVIGWYLSSIAFTNDPFIQGMVPIAAVRSCGDPLRALADAKVAAAISDEQAAEIGAAYYATLMEAGTELAKYPWKTCIADQKKAGHSQESAEKICGYIKKKYGKSSERAEGDEQPVSAAARAAAKLLLSSDGIDSLLSELRWTFGLGELADAQSIAAEVQKLRGFIAAGQAPPGVDLDSMASRVKNLLGLPKLSTGEELVAEIDKLVAKLATAVAAPPAPTAAGEPVATITVTAATKTQSASRQHDCDRAGWTGEQEKDIPMNELLKILAKRFNIPTDEAQIKERVLAALAGGEKAADALKTLLAALESPDLEAGVAKIAEFKQNVEQLEMVLPELKALGEAVVQEEEAAAVEDVDQAMSVMSAHDGMKPALMAYRTGGVALDLAELRAEKDAQKAVDQIREAIPKRLAARERFRKEYLSGDAPPDTQTPAYLNQALVTSPEPKSPMLRALAGTPRGPRMAQNAPAQPPPRIGEGGSELRSEVDKCAGRNITEKAISLVRSRPGGAEMTFEQLHAEACKIVRELNQLS